MKLHIARFLAMTLALGFVAVADFDTKPAAASEYSIDDLNTYLMDLENASAPSDAREYLSHNGVTYFTALSLQYGRALWAMDETSFDVSFKYNPFTGINTGNITRLFAHGDYLFFWANKTTGFDGYVPMVLEISTGEVSSLEVAGTAISAERGSSFVEHSNNVYFIGSNDGQTTERLYRFNTSDASIMDVGLTGFTHRSNVGASTPNDVRGGDLSLFEHAGHLFTVIDYPSAVDGLAIYDIAGDSWNTSVASDSWPILLGEFNYAGTDEALVMIASTVSTSSGSDYKLFSISTAGVRTAIGSENTSSSNGFKPLQFGSRLLAIHNNTLVEVNTSDGSFDDLTTVVAGSGSTFSLKNMQLSSGKIFLTGSVNSANEGLYLWSGNNAEQMTQISTVTALTGSNGNGIGLYPSLDGSPDNNQSGSSPTGMVRSLYRDSSVGFEPYHINFDGTVTLIRQFNLGSEGSNPNITCSVEQNGQLFQRFEVVTREPNSATTSQAMAIVTPTSTNLEYEVFIASADIGGTTFELKNMCGFASDGSNVFFTAVTTSSSQDRLFKRAADGTITYLTDVANDSRKTVYHDGKLFMAITDGGQSSIWKYDIAANQLTQLTGIPVADPIDDDTVRAKNFIAIGDKLFFRAEIDSTNHDFVFMQDMDEAFNPTKINQSLGPDGNLNPDDFMVHNGALYFEDDPEADGIKSVFRYDPVADQLTNVYTPAFSGVSSANFDYFESSDIGLYALTSASTTRLMKISDTGSDEEIALPSGFVLEEIAAIPGGLMVSSNTGVPYTYDGSTFTQLDLSFAGVTFAPGQAISSEHGTFFQYSEYPFDSAGTWGGELGYIGALQPQAVKRFGQTVSEDPAQPFTTNTAILEGRANGTIAPQIIRPNSTIPTPYSGPIITDIGEDNIAAPYQTFGGQTVRVDGDRLSGVTKVFIDGKEGTVVSTADDHFVMIAPEGLTPGIYNLEVESSLGNLTYLDGFVVADASANFSAANAVCDGVEPSWWTQRISDTEAKAYIKCPAVGQKYRILQQTGGSGSYDSIFAKTLTDENDTTQVFNEFGRYIVRTIDLEDINRIRIRVDDVELWKVRYNNPPTGVVTY